MPTILPDLHLSRQPNQSLPNQVGIGISFPDPFWQSYSNANLIAGGQEDVGEEALGARLADLGGAPPGGSRHPDLVLVGRPRRGPAPGVRAAGWQFNRLRPFFGSLFKLLLPYRIRNRTTVVKRV